MAGEPFAQELAQRLSLVIGMIMEDEVDAAISTARDGPRQLADRLSGLNRAGDDISKLAAAAEVVIRRYAAP